MYTKLHILILWYSMNKKPHDWNLKIFLFCLVSKFENVQGKGICFIDVNLTNLLVKIKSTYLNNLYYCCWNISYIFKKNTLYTLNYYVWEIILTNY